MPKVNITKASKLANMSRSKFYENYINTGKISVDKSNPKKPLVDTSEIIRVFGTLYTGDIAESDNRDSEGQYKNNVGDNEKQSQNDNYNAKLYEMEKRLLVLEGENKMLHSKSEILEDRLRDKDQIIEDQRSQINTQLDIINRSQLLLEDKQQKQLSWIDKLMGKK